MFISLKYNDFKGCLARDVVAILPPWGLAIGVTVVGAAWLVKFQSWLPRRRDTLNFFGLQRKRKSISCQFTDLNHTGKVSFTQTLLRRRLHWNKTKSSRKESNSIPDASMLMLQEFSHRSKINAILEKKMRESRKIAPQNDPWGRSADRKHTFFFLALLLLIFTSMISILHCDERRQSC